MSRVSVAVASYNHARFVGQAVESVLAQSFQDFEVCVTDDGSADGTADVVAGFADPRIRLVRLPANRGACVALNDAIRRSRGEYVAVLNSDDAFLPDKLEVQVEFLDRHPEVGAVFGYPMFIDEEGRPLAPEDTFNGRIFEADNRTQAEWLRHFFYVSNCLCHPTLLIRRECYERTGLYDERLAQLPDFDMWIRLVARYPIHVMPEMVTMFRILPGERNASGRSPASVARTHFELGKVARRFLGIDEPLFRGAFGRELDRIGLPPGTPRAFALARLALESDKAHLRRLGLDLLFDLLPEQGDAGAAAPGFTHADLIRAAGADDLLNVVFRAEAKATIQRLNERIAELEESANAAPAEARTGWFGRLKR